MTNDGNPATIFFLKPWLSLFFRITLQRLVVQESEPGSSEHVQMLARAQVLDGHKSWESKSYISSQPRRLAALFTRLVWIDVKEGLFHMVGRRDVVLYYVFRQRLFFTLKNKLHLPAFFVFCPFSLSFFQEKKSDTVYVFVTCRFYLFFPVYKYMEDFFLCGNCKALEHE